MDIVKLAFEMFKDELFDNRNNLRIMIKNKFKNITDKQLNEVTLEIVNYQIEKYGGKKKETIIAPNINEGKFKLKNCQKYSSLTRKRHNDRTCYNDEVERRINRIYKKKENNQKKYYNVI